MARSLSPPHVAQMRGSLAETLGPPGPRSSSVLLRVHLANPWPLPRLSDDQLAVLTDWALGALPKWPGVGSLCGTGRAAQHGAPEGTRGTAPHTPPTCVCISAHGLSHMHTFIHTHTHPGTHTLTHSYILIMSAHNHTCTHVLPCTNTPLHMRAHLHSHTPLHMRARLHTHTHTPLHMRAHLHLLTCPDGG